MVDEEDIQRVDGPSEQYVGSWDNQWVGGTALDDAEPVREAAGQYRETEDVGVVMDTREAEGTDSGVEEGQGSMQDGERERSGSIVRHDNGSREEREHYLRGKKIWVRRRPLVHWCGGASVLTRSHGEEEEASETTTKVSYLQAVQRVVRV